MIPPIVYDMKKLYPVGAIAHPKCLWLIVGFTLSSCHTAPAEVPTHDWLTGFGGVSEDFSRAVVVDKLGNSYVTGSFSGTASFGETTLTSSGSSDVFLAKLNRHGETLWAVRAGSGSTATEEGRALAVDDAGHVFLTGGFSGDSTFGSTNLMSRGGLDVFLAKYTAYGEVVWARSFGGSADFEYGLGLALDPAGNILLTGQFQGVAIFGTTNLISRGGQDAFLAKCSGNGEVLWVSQAGGTQTDIGRTVATDASGDSYVSGWFAGATTFGQSTVLNSAGSSDAFVARYDPQGNLVRVTSFATARADLAYGFALDAAANGYFLAWTDSIGGSQLVLQKFNAAGAFQWSRAMRVNSDASARGSLVADSAGNTFFTSQFSGVADFAGRMLQSRGTADAFVARFDSTGGAQWVAQAGGPGVKEGRGVALDGFGGAIVTGRFNVSVGIGALELATAGLGDVFIARFNEPPVLEVLLSADSVAVSWPSSATRLKLQIAGRFPADASWQDVVQVPSEVAGRKVVRNSLTSSNRFYRLSEQ